MLHLTSLRKQPRVGSIRQDFHLQTTETNFGWCKQGIILRAFSSHWNTWKTTALYLGFLSEILLLLLFQKLLKLPLPPEILSHGPFFVCFSSCWYKPGVSACHWLNVGFLTELCFIWGGRQSKYLALLAFSTGAVPLTSIFRQGSLQI